MNAVPIVRAMPTMIPNKKFMSADLSECRPFSDFPVFVNAQEGRGVPFGVGTSRARMFMTVAAFMGIKPSSLVTEIDGVIETG